jgi:hypothetical protein
MRLNPEKLTTVKVEVTERLIKRGKVNDSFDCPFALALRKLLRKNVEVDASYEHITLTMADLSNEEATFHEESIITPARVSKFMERIDARETDPYAIEDDEQVPAKLPPLPKPFSINLKIKNKFLKPSLRK